jgi:hypothetical protein
VAHHADAVRHAGRAAGAHVLEDELGVRNRALHELERLEDRAAVVDLGQRPRAQDDRAGAELEPFAHGGPRPVRRRERAQVDAPVDEHGRIPFRPEGEQALDQGDRVGHRQVGAVESDAVRQRLDPAGPEDVGSPRHRHERRDAGQRGERRVAAEPVGVNDVRLQVAAEPTDPADVGGDPRRGPAWVGGGRHDGDTGARERGRRELRLDIAGHRDVEPALVHGQREVLDVRVVHGTEHQEPHGCQSSASACARR